jgi:SAM-dependent methyltransferase
MRHYAETAIVHAEQEHGVALTWSLDSVEVVDQILEQQRKSGNCQNEESLALCYGCWLGELLVEVLQGKWTGLHEPEPPRVEVCGVPVSPIDAVRRRLTDASQPPLAGRVSELARQFTETQTKAANLVQNEQAWDALAHHPAFANVQAIGPPIDKAAALAAIDPWLRETPLDGKRLLCLAAGGGTHSLLHAAAGAVVTVVDISSEMLAIDQQLSAQHGQKVTTVKASMQDLSALPDASFDIVLQPVSCSYVADVMPVYQEVARVLCGDGCYVVQHKQPATLQSSAMMVGEGYQLLHPAFAGTTVDSGNATAAQPLEAGTIETIHPLAALIGGLCESGFVIEAFAEPTRADAWAEPGSRQHRACYLPPYFKLKARRLP